MNYRKVYFSVHTILVMSRGFKKVLPARGR
jgi:hypothetical protein